MNSHFFSSRKGLVALFVMLILAAQPGRGAVTTAVAPATPLARLVTDGQATLGQPLQVRLVVENAPGIAGYETLLSYEAQRLQFSGLQQRDAGIAQAGGKLYPFGPIQLENGTTFGAISCLTQSCAPSVRNAGQRAAPASGTVKLATITLVPLRAGAVTLKLADLKVVDPQGALVPLTLVDELILDVEGAEQDDIALALDEDDIAAIHRQRTITPAGGHSADLTHDGRIDEADVMDAVFAWIDARQRGDLCGAAHAPEVDVVGDGCVDVADMQRVAAQFGITVQGVLAPVATPVAPAGDATPQQASFVVNSLADDDDANYGDDICATAAGECTLRAAIREANRRAGADLIAFAIPVSGTATIQLTEALPALNDASGGTTVDGYTQPGAQPNTDPLVSNARIGVELRGAGAAAYNALAISTPNNVVRGLAIYNVHRAVYIGAGAGNILAGNFIGLDAAGMTPYSLSQTEPGADGAYGIQVDRDTPNTLIGGPALADRNVISGNARDGLYVINGGNNGTKIINNIVGLDPTGTQRRRNWGDGVDLNFDVPAVQIGGTGPNERNLISGNNGEGIEISHTTNTRDNVVAGNFIGSDATGRRGDPSVVGNRGHGINMHDRISFNTIGPANVVINNGKGGIYLSSVDAATGNRIIGNRIGVDLDDLPAGNGFGNYAGVNGDGILLLYNTPQTTVTENIIAHNSTAGIRIRGGNQFNVASRNSFFANGGMGIDIGGVGPTRVTTCTTRPENQCIAAPVITTVNPESITGTACAGCTVELYRVAANGDIAGEGNIYLTSTTADGNGQFSFAAPAPEPLQSFTATATDPAGNTSEFAYNTHFYTLLPLVVK